MPTHQMVEISAKLNALEKYDIINLYETEIGYRPVKFFRCVETALKGRFSK